MADAAISRDRSVVLAIQVADCLPVLFASADGRVIGAAHAGWRGLAEGVLEATLTAMQAADPTLRGADIHAWLGPCIGAAQFEVGAEVRAAFLQAGDPAAAFCSNARGRWQADLVALARFRLQRAGVTEISGGQWCTVSEPDSFFSHRREHRAGGQSGRMAALLWMQHDA
jgi:YfiH family protein